MLLSQSHCPSKIPGPLQTPQSSTVAIAGAPSVPPAQSLETPFSEQVLSIAVPPQVPQQSSTFPLQSH